MGNVTTSVNGIKKLYLEEMVLFAVNNIPQVDPATLEHFLELVNVDGNFGTISHEQILRKMRQVLKYIPDACGQSFLILMDLLEIKSFEQLALTSAQAGWTKINAEAQNPMLLVMKASSTAAKQ